MRKLEPAYLQRLAEMPLSEAERREAIINLQRGEAIAEALHTLGQWLRRAPRRLHVAHSH